MIRKTIDKEEAKKIIDNFGDNVKVYSDNYWNYPLDLPQNLRDARNSIMLDVMIEIEKHPGILIYIPNKELKND
jgi:hypothetical protein